MKNSIFALLMVLSLSSFAQDNETKYRLALVDHNKKVIAHFYSGLERKDYSSLKGVFDFYGTAIWTNQNKSNYDTINGREAIGNQFKTNIDGFYKVKYSTKVNEGVDPSTLTVKVRESLATADGTKSERTYLATFKLKNGKIVEYIEYNNSAPSARS